MMSIVQPCWNQALKCASRVPWGRSLEEYKAIFSLNKDDLSKTILGCGDGPASFNSEITRLGGTVTSIDPIYCFSSTELEGRIGQVYMEIMLQMEINKDKFVWGNIPSVADLGNIRMKAMTEFLSDYEKGKEENRYIAASLPNLQFPDAHFDLALCSHYLFLYSEQVSLKDHIESLLELCRVAREVRVYPLLSLNGELSPHLEAAVSELGKLGHKSELVSVTYQFQKGATQMLVINTCNK